MKNVIFLLDDLYQTAQDLTRHINNFGNKDYSILSASSIEDAEKIIRTEKIDYAILDLKIDYESEFGGIHVVNFIKRLQPKVRIILLSAHPFSDEIEAMLEVEIDDYIRKGEQENYILSVINSLTKIKATPHKRKCFVIMPFSTSHSCNEEEWTDIFNTLIKPAVEKSGFNYECVRAIALPGNNIIEHIFDEINGADLVIADLTDKNPNVFYELGVRHALRDCTILIAQNEKDIPFDLKPYATISYDWKEEIARKKFEENIKYTINYIETNSEKAISPVRKYLNL
ncbi:MAG TPA: response regulator [Saprospiraceae bacterium]|nr:response regulator [Saprospiraceae bacterium]